MDDGKMNLHGKSVFVYDITDGLENITISFENCYNATSVPQCVKYVSRCILTSQSCLEDFDCKPAPCNCLKNCTHVCSCFFSGTGAYNEGILDEKYLGRRSIPIVECTICCVCDDSCQNKVVQKGIRFKLQVFMTQSKGLGVRTLDFIPKLGFVCEYAGEIIDKSELKKRIKNRSCKDPNYIFVLKEHSFNQDSILTIIDPTFIGNVGRYLNHSCSPNLVPVPIRSNSMVPSICFFAKQNIMPLEELTYNYAENFNVGNVLSSESSVHPKCACYCSSSNCSGFLPFDDNWFS